MSVFQYLALNIINILILIIFVSIIMSWLVGFNVINLRNNLVRQIYYSLETISNYILDPIRKFLPPIGGLDLSPIVALIGLNVVAGLVSGRLTLF